MQVIISLDDPRVAFYRNLRERNLRDEGFFITEGALLAERLLQSRFPVESFFVTEDNAPRFGQLLHEFHRPQTPLYVASAALIREIVGFDFHRGVLGLGRRLPFSHVAELVQPSENHAHFLACPDTETSENLGLILRSALAFGTHGMLLSKDGADPLSRRCLRQSMGSALTLSIAVSDDLLNDLVALRKSQNLKLIAAVASDDATIAISDFQFSPRAVLIVGNEYQGLNDAWLAQCDYRVTIPIAPQCDSLNVAVATGIFLHKMRESLSPNSTS